MLIITQSQKIFESPIEEKKRCTIQTNNRGWSGIHSETLDPKNQRVGDFKEYNPSYINSPPYADGMESFQFW